MVAGMSRGIEGYADAIAIVPGVAGENCDLFGRLNAAALQGFTQDGLFELELRFVVCVLIVATAACAKVRTGRGNALRRGGEDFIGIGGVIAALVLRDAHTR